MALDHQIYQQPPASLVGLRRGRHGRARRRHPACAGQDARGPLARLGGVRQGAVRAGVQATRAPGAAVRSARLRALPVAARPGVLHRLWRHRALGSGTPRAGAATKGHALYKRGQEGNSFHILAKGEVEVFRDGSLSPPWARHLGRRDGLPGAQPAAARAHSTDIRVSEECTPSPSRPRPWPSSATRVPAPLRPGFIQVLVRLHAAHESLAHPRRIL